MIDVFVSIAAWFVVVAVGIAFVRWILLVGSGRPRYPRRYWRPRIRRRW